MTRVLRLLAAMGACASALGVLFVTHLPAPSAIGTSEEDPRREAVREVWHGFRDVGAALPDLPAFFDPLRSDKTIHFLIFVPPAALGALAFGRRLDRRRATLLLGALAAWAAVDEISQALTGRIGDPADALANVAGAAVGIALALPVRWLVSRLTATTAPRPDPPPPRNSAG